MTDVKQTLLKAEWDYATKMARRVLEIVQNKAMLDKKAPPVVVLGFVIAAETLLKQGEAAYREAGYAGIADKLSEALRTLSAVGYDMRRMVFDEVTIKAERGPKLRAVTTAADVAVGSTQTDA